MPTLSGERVAYVAEGFHDSFSKSCNEFIYHVLAVCGYAIRGLMSVRTFFPYSQLLNYGIRSLDVSQYDLEECTIISQLPNFTRGDIVAFYRQYFRGQRVNEDIAHVMIALRPRLLRGSNNVSLFGGSVLLRNVNLYETNTKCDFRGCVCAIPADALIHYHQRA